MRAHPYKEQEKHGFIGSQRKAWRSFAGIDPEAPLIVAEAVWQYSHHVLPGLIAHRGPILTVANWSGTWPGLVGMLNLNGSLTKAGVEVLDALERGLRRRRVPQASSANWLEKGKCEHTHRPRARRWPK